MKAYYNEIDPKAAAWLRELIKQGYIAPGDVDERSIVDVTAKDLMGYRQCHFFAGISVWSYALRKAGWPDDRQVWTGSCPCQPFSAAGKGKGKDDERHLWPHFYRLIEKCRPEFVFGEQVGSKAGLDWLDDVQADLEESRYTCGAVTFPACSVGAPHQRQRIYWVADAISNAERPTHRQGDQKRTIDQPHNRNEFWDITRNSSSVSGLSDTSGQGLQGHRRLRKEQVQKGRQGTERYSSEGCESDRLAQSELHKHRGQIAGSYGEAETAKISNRQEIALSGQSGGDVSDVLPAGPTNGLWRDADWLLCRDGKWRPVEPGTFPLVDGAAERVGRLRGYGNCIVAPQAIIFIETFMEIQNASKKIL